MIHILLELHGPYDPTQTILRFYRQRAKIFVIFEEETLLWCSLYVPEDKSLSFPLDSCHGALAPIFGTGNGLILSWFLYPVRNSQCHSWFVFCTKIFSMQVS